MAVFDARLPLEILEQICEALVQPDYLHCTNRPVGFKALFNLLQVSHSMYRLAFPFYYSNLGRWSTVEASKLDHFLGDHSDKRIFAYVKDVSFTVGFEEPRHAEIILRILEWMVNIESLIFYSRSKRGYSWLLTMFTIQSPGTSAQERALRTILSRLYRFQIIDQYTRFESFQGIGSAVRMKSLRLPDKLPSSPLVFPPNLRLLVYDGLTTFDTPCLRLNSLTFLEIRLSTLANYLDRMNNQDAQGHTFDFLPPTLTHLNLNCTDFNPSNMSLRMNIHSFLSALSQLEITHLETNILFEDLGLYSQMWIEAFPASLTHWHVKCERFRRTPWRPTREEFIEAVREFFDLTDSMGGLRRLREVTMELRIDLRWVRLFIWDPIEDTLRGERVVYRPRYERGGLIGW